MQIKEIYCKSILSRSKIYGADYSINPYFGCLHGCTYCYARYMLRKLPSNLMWGEFVHAKINAPTVLLKELRRSKRGRVLLSSVTDPYQLVEAKYMLTRRILTILSSKDYPLIILTKSDLVIRDLDLIKKFSDADVGLTVITLDENVRRAFEPKAPSIYRRIAAMQKLKEAKICTYAFLGPLIPIISEFSIEKLLTKLSKINVDYVIVDKLNVKAGNKPHIMRAFMLYYPDIKGKIEKILSNENVYDEYYADLKVKIRNLAQKLDLDLEFCY
ncbi:MAG: radical SAM protein [Candidatus Methanomethylicota archaeon]|uniref:Radical SAM protein n=1 Tax=Thermoproteota archaeon TaxID=2056631 RepID=A0A497F3D9_9CREN|nr:MAG: radical SAM protein [Candidatus Verstraetearchaeota archaeon]